MLKDTELLIHGTDRTGKLYESIYAMPLANATLDALVSHYREMYPQCIHVEVSIAFPDPDYMRQKNENSNSD